MGIPIVNSYFLFSTLEKADHPPAEARSIVARKRRVVLKVFPMAAREEGQNLERLFTLAEATRLLPQLREHLTSVQAAKAVLIRTKDEIKKASAQAAYGGGSFAGPHYIAALEQISEHLQAVQELGVHVKDLDMGLCDFPHLLDGRIVYLCWKLGEADIRWWHEVHSGYADRQPLESDES